MADFNDIGIPRQLDWPRVRKLLTIGVFGALLHLTGDLILGWGVEDESLTGLFRTLSAYTATRDGGILASALLGLLGMTLEGLSLFGVYRLMAERSPRDAHRYRSGILGYLIFGACGFHVPTCALVFLGKQGLPEETLARFALYFLLPATALFWVFFLLLAVTQIAAFAKGRTPYPRWCWVWWGASRPRPWAFSAISHSSTPSPAPGLPSAASGCSAASSAWPNQRSGAPTPSK